jgi:hypothetical protein
VTLTNANGTTVELAFSDQFPAAIVGRIDDFTVALRSGSVYVVRIAFGTLGSTLSAGRYRIDARFEGQGAKFINGDTLGVAPLNFWNGTLQSNSFELDIPGKRARKVTASGGIEVLRSSSCACEPTASAMHAQDHQPVVPSPPPTSVITDQE